MHTALTVCTVWTLRCSHRHVLLYAGLQPHSWICNSTEMSSNLWKPKAKFYRRKETRKNAAEKKTKTIRFCYCFNVSKFFFVYACIQRFAMTRHTVILSISLSLPLPSFLLVSFQMKWAFPKQISALDTAYTSHMYRIYEQIINIAIVFKLRSRNKNLFSDKFVCIEFSVFLFFRFDCEFVCDSRMLSIWMLFSFFRSNGLNTCAILSLMTPTEWANFCLDNASSL